MTADEIIDRLESDGILTRVPEFEWHPGIPSRNRICRAVFGEGSGMLLKVSHLTALRLVLVEETTPDWMPIRTLVRIDLQDPDRFFRVPDDDAVRVERALRDLGIRPA